MSMPPLLAGLSAMLLIVAVSLPTWPNPAIAWASIANQPSASIRLDMHDIFYGEKELEIPANTNVTIELVNEGVVEHNFSIDALQISETVPTGLSNEVLINAPAGRYAFYCNVPGHKEAGMTGTLIVVETDATSGSNSEQDPSATGLEEESGPEATISALQTEVARLEAEDSSPTPSAAVLTPAPTEASEMPEESASPRTVNVELILDVSGSMGQVLDTGETRMDAAKRVLDGVITAIPDRDGINVGLRIYGFAGDNTEVGQAVSCQSSELVVPVEGVNKEALGQQVFALQPTGWTPIALSLERAAVDLPEASEDAKNAVVLVTDGLETCGGDPVAAAGDLRAGDAEAVVHVIGFALTAEEQQLLAGIAEQGEGMLLGAGTADELSQALFSVLEELEIVAGTGYVGGNAITLMPPGDSGELSVVATGTMDNIGRIPFVVRNNTTQDVVDVKVATIVRDSGGNLAGRADSLEARPHFVPAGGVAFGYVYFGNVSLPADAQFEFEAEATPADAARFTIFRDLDIAEAALFEDRIVGVAENGHDGLVQGPLGFGAICFDLEGIPLGYNSGSVNTGELDPGESEEFQVTVYSWAVAGAGCPAFFVAGSGIGT